jgi:hypothetical protein
MIGDTALMAVVQGVHVDVEQPNLPEDDAAFPYITFGGDTLNAFDTKTDDGFNALCQIDIWSRQNNLTQAKEIGQLLHDLFHHQDLTITGYNHIISLIESQAYSKDPDGHTKRGLILMRVLYDES